MAVKKTKKVAKKKDTDVVRTGRLTGAELNASGASARKRSHALRKTIQSMLPSGVIDDLQKEVLENWVEALQSDNMQIWLGATKEISKYLFPQKREHQVTPNVNINCSFNGIKTDDAMGGKIINDQTDTKLLEQIKTDLMAQVAQIDIILHGRKGK